MTTCGLVILLCFLWLPLLIENAQYDSHFLRRWLFADLLECVLELLLTHAMGQHDNLCLSITRDALLRDAMQAHPDPAECMAEIADHTRRIERLDAYVVRICSFTDRDDFRHMLAYLRLEITSEVRELERAGEIYQVADHGTRRRQPSGTRASQHDLSDGAPADEDRIVDALDTRQRMMQRYEHRVRPHIKRLP